MKEEKRLKYKVYYDTETGNIIGFNTHDRCQGCQLFKTYGNNDLRICPSNLQGALVSDRDKTLPPVLKRPPWVKEVKAELIIYL